GLGRLPAGPQDRLRRPGRVRRGLLHVSGGRRPVLAGVAGGVDRVLRARGQGRARPGSVDRPAPLPHDPGPPPLHAALLGPVNPRGGTPPAPGGGPGHRGQDGRGLPAPPGRRRPGPPRAPDRRWRRVGSTAVAPRSTRRKVSRAPSIGGSRTEPHTTPQGRHSPLALVVGLAEARGL